MKHKRMDFSPSVNIIRDYHKDLDYVVTSNARKVASQIISDFNTNLHSFSIIGSYGTGKSSFLWALEKNLNNEKEFFFKLNGQFNNLRKFEILNIVGSYSPFEELLSKSLKLKNEVTIENTLNGLVRLIKKCEKANKFLLIIVDEFGKILEYAAQNEPEKRIYFIQQLAEIINNPDNNIILINTLHQNFNAYSNGLSNEQKQEWNKVRGRFVELTFNEPIEQLLFLAANKISKWSNGVTTLSSKLKHEAIIKSQTLTITNNNANKLSSLLAPLDVISACILARSLQDYGQNERSLFTFLSRRNKNSLYYYANNNKVFSLIETFEFLYSNFYNQIVDRYNRDKSKWDRIKVSLDRVHYLFDKDKEIAEKLIKAIGLLSIYGNKAGKINSDFLETYFQSDNVRPTLKRLEKFKIILFRRYLDSYTLTEGTDLDFYEAIEEAAANVDVVEDIPAFLNSYYSLPYLHAKKVSYIRGTPRFFKYKITDKLEDEMAIGEIDGYIYLIFNTKLKVKELVSFSRSSHNANIYVHFNNTSEVKRLIFEMQKVDFVLHQIENDKIAEEELQKIKEILKNQLNREVLESLYSQNNNADWVYRGNRHQIHSERFLNNLLSEVCDTTFSLTPIIKNELINKHKISTAVSTARRNYIRTLLKNSHLEDLGFDKKKFPPEKTIYQTLLQNTKIHGLIENNIYGFKSPNDKSINQLWDICEKFLNNTVNEEKGISELVDKLKEIPFKLKDGLIHFWVPTFLIVKQNEYALFKDGNYLPFLSEELFDLFYKNPKLFSIRAYPFRGVEVVAFNKYRELFDIQEKKQITNQSIIETIKPFLLFYKGLPYFAQNTNLISPQAQDFRDSIANASDPYTAFFIDFPNALGKKSLDFSDSKELTDYINLLKKVINELRDSYTMLVNRFEAYITSLVDYQQNSGHSLQESIADPFSSISIEKLSPIHKKFLGRIRLPYDTSKMWLESLSVAILDKALKDITDKEEETLHSSFDRLYNDLENLIPLHKLLKKKDVIPENIIGVKIIDTSGNDIPIQTVMKFKDNVLLERTKKGMKKSLIKLSPNEQKSVLIELLKDLMNE